MFTVYKHTTPNGKVYVGITSRKVEDRWLNGHGYHHNQYFENAIKKYGWRNIKHEILFKDLPKEEAEKIERGLIKVLKSNQREYGYNICQGGDVGRLGVKHSKEAKERISRAGIGRKKTEEQRKRQSERQKGKAPVWCLPYTHSEEAERKRRETIRRTGVLVGRHKGSKSPKAKRIRMLDLDGNYIRSFGAFTEAQEEMKIAYSSIVKVCRGQRKSAGGYKWQYE